MKALKTLDGIGSIWDIARVVILQSQLPYDVVLQLHRNGRQTELEYRLAWARTVLKTCGLIYNLERGVWALTEKGSEHPPIKAQEIRRMYLDLRSDQIGNVLAPPFDSPQEGLEDEFWSRLTTEQFFAGYDEADVAYDPV